MERILVVDDDPIMRETIMDILEFEGYQVELATDGLEALNMLSTAPFDMVVTDVLMPGRDGFEVINECKQSYPNLKVVAISGGGYISSDAYLKMATDIGAHAIVGKPFDVDSFLDTIRSLLSQPNP